MKKSLIAMLTFSIGSLLLTCALCESLVWIFNLRNLIPPPPETTEQDPYTENPYIITCKDFLFFHIPFSNYIQKRADYEVDYKINSHGFRGPEISCSSKNQKKRILLIGDSMVEGHGLDFNSTLPFLMNENLSSFGYEVINVGVQGGSPVYYATNLDRYLQFNPDIVVMILYENDLWEDRQREQNYNSLEHFDDIKKLLSTSKKGFLDNLFISSKIKLIFNQIEKSAAEQEIDVNIIKVNKNINLLPTSSPFDTKRDSVKENWEMSSKYLDICFNEFTSKKVEFFLVYLNLIPYLDLKLFPTINPDFKKVSASIDTFSSNWAKGKNIKFLSLSPYTKELFLNKNVFDVIIQDDGHPTKETMSHIEKIIREWTLSNLDKSN